MRKKVTDYLEKPSKKLFADLTTMEQRYVDSKTKPDQQKAKPQGK